MGYEELYQRAVKYAKDKSGTRCAYLGSETCRTCKSEHRGACDFRNRRDAFIAGGKFIAYSTIGKYHNL